MIHNVERLVDGTVAIGTILGAIFVFLVFLLSGSRGFLVTVLVRHCEVVRPKSVYDSMLEAFM
jgi:hypothetical protein